MWLLLPLLIIQKRRATALSSHSTLSSRPPGGFLALRGLCLLLILASKTLLVRLGRGTRFLGLGCMSGVHLEILVVEAWFGWKKSFVFADDRQRKIMIMQLKSPENHENSMQNVQRPAMIMVRKRGKKYQKNSAREVLEPSKISTPLCSLHRTHPYFFYAT
jgi:hypothetical protein